MKTHKLTSTLGTAVIASSAEVAKLLVLAKSLQFLSIFCRKMKITKVKEKYLKSG